MRIGMNEWTEWIPVDQSFAFFRADVECGYPECVCVHAGLRFLHLCRCKRAETITVELGQIAWTEHSFEST